MRRIMNLRRLRATPPVLVIQLIAANIAAFYACGTGGAPVPANVLVSDGALTSATLRTGQYWRLVTSGFLHADSSHLAANMFSLLLLGKFVERRLGATAFALVYGASLVGGGVVSVLAHAAPFVGVGASGAVFGLLGALFALWVLGKAGVDARFFLINFGLNAAIAARVPNIDVAAHLGGLAAGMASVALLDPAARAAGILLRCRFPEFVSANALLLAAAGGVQLWLFPVRIPGADPRLVGIAAWAIGAAAFVKMLDLLLSVRRGLAWVILLLAAYNGVLAYGGVVLLAPTLGGACRSGLRPTGMLDALVQLLCPALGQAPAVAAALACAATLLLLARALRRGLGDVGFVAATFVGDRRRADGL